MRTATGILLIIAAVFNLFASLYYIARGGVASYGSELTSEMNSQLNQGMQIDSEESRVNIQESSQFVSELSEMGIMLLVIGIFLLMSVGILITGAVFLFKNNHPIFAQVSGIVAILAEIFCIWVSMFDVMNIIGLIAGRY